MVLNHQFTPSCTSSKLVELLASGNVLFLNHLLHTPFGSQVTTVAIFLVSLEPICSGLGVRLISEGDSPSELSLIPVELNMHPKVVW